MYCLGFRSAGQPPEQRGEHSPVQGRYLEKIDQQFRGQDGESTLYKMSKTHPTIKTYHSPPWKRDERIVAAYSHSDESKTSSPSHEALERESRFQKELLQAHQDIRKKTTKYVPLNCDQMEGGVLSSADITRADSTVFDYAMNDHVNSRLMKEYRKLEKELRRTCKFLECERVEKNELQGRVEMLQRELEELRGVQENQDDGHRSQRLLLQSLHREVMHYKKQLEEECTKSLKLQGELEMVRRDNQKCREQMDGLISLQPPNVPSPENRDIGACNRKVVETPDRVADYELGQRLGEGHYGKVAVATDLVTRKNFAIKVIDKSKIVRSKDLQQVAMEVRVLKKFAHPNIVHLHEVIHAPENIYLVTELCSMDLHRYHNEVGLSEYGAQQVIFGILKPLHHLHSHGICHLDLKPENILLAANFDIKNVTHHDVRLCDFGLVCMAKNPYKEKQILRRGYACGTPGFFAPEMVLRNAFEGRQADMWSLGCIILEITLGFTQEWIDSYDCADSDHLAFSGGILKCLEEIAPKHYPRHSNLLSIIHGCLSIDTTKRMTSSAALFHPWLRDTVETEEGRQDGSGAAAYQIEADAGVPQSITSTLF
jgi:serine/threonine protein kinase